MDQPFGGEVGGCADSEHAGALPLLKALGANRDPVERIADDIEVLATSLRDHQTLTFTIEELDSELGLKGLDLLADRALGDAELARRLGEALVAGRSLEGSDCIERRQPARHRTTEVIRKTRAG